jgi:hypothetical protein
MQEAIVAPLLLAEVFLLHAHVVGREQLPWEISQALEAAGHFVLFVHSRALTATHGLLL